MSDVIEFPINKTKKSKQDKVNDVLADDQNYRFIRDLLAAVSDAGLEMDSEPEEKARELYAKYQQDNTLADWEKERSKETDQKK